MTDILNAEVAEPKSDSRQGRGGAGRKPEVEVGDQKCRAGMLRVNGCWANVEAPWQGHSTHWNRGVDWRRIQTTDHAWTLANGMPWYDFFVPHDRDPADPTTRYVVCAKGSANWTTAWGTTHGANPPANGPDTCGVFVPMLLEGYPALLLFVKHIPACPPPWVPEQLHDVDRTFKRQRRADDKRAAAAWHRHQAEARMAAELERRQAEVDAIDDSIEEAEDTL